MTTPVALAPFNELQKALYDTLSGGLAVSVLDDVPETQLRPWVTIGESIMTPDNWHGGFGWDALATVHVWTTSFGFKSALDIAAEIIALLDHQLDALDLGSVDWYVLALRFVQLQTLRDPNPRIRHVPVQFRITIHQQEV